MRSYDCYYYHKAEDGNLFENFNHSCWNGINIQRPFNLISVRVDNKSQVVKLNDKFKNVIFIDNYIDKDVSNETRKKIVKLINKITPCSFTTIKSKTYIKYTLLKNHYSDLVILNLIRTMWYDGHTSVFNVKQFHIDLQDRKSSKKDVLEFIMERIAKNVINTNNTYHYGDHSFVYPNIIPKTKDRLCNYTGNSMESFLKMK
ncbi:MAG TPA: hypothetical protein VF680_17120 [Allosphingosinicella sp.]|jgi:hypothetical protein